MTDAIKKIANDACQSVYEEWRAGAHFENMPLAIAARMQMGWMELERSTMRLDEADKVFERASLQGKLSYYDVQVAEALQRYEQERDRALSELSIARDALAGMVNQYMWFSQGYISHEFMGAQEDAIEYLEQIGWLRDTGLERYQWTEKSGHMPQEPA